jgi:hypothetical protein
MSSEYRWEELETLFDAALDYPPEERVSWVLEACGDDIELRREVEQVLAAQERAEGVLEQSLDTLASGVLAEIEARHLAKKTGERDANGVELPDDPETEPETGD